MEYFLEFYGAVTGEELNANELLKRGERIWNMYKLLNLRLGFGRKQDAAPELWFEPIKTGDKKRYMMDYFGKKIITKADTERMLDEYYEARGWERETGIPSLEFLESIGLADYGLQIDPAGR